MRTNKLFFLAVIFAALLFNASFANAATKVEKVRFAQIASAKKGRHTAPTKLPTRTWRAKNKKGQWVRYTETGTISGHQQYHFTKKGLSWQNTNTLPAKGAVKSCVSMSFTLVLRAVVEDGASARAQAVDRLSGRNCQTGSSTRVRSTDEYLCHITYKRIRTASKSKFNFMLRRRLRLQVTPNRVPTPAPATPAPAPTTPTPAPTPTPQAPEDRWPTITMTVPPHIYAKSATSTTNPNQVMFLETSDADNEPQSVDIGFLDEEGYPMPSSPFLQINSIISIPTRWDGSPCPAGITCWRASLWGLNPGWQTIIGLVTAGNGFGSTLPYRIEVRQDEGFGRSAATTLVVPLT